MLEEMLDKLGNVQTPKSINDYNIIRSNIERIKRLRGEEAAIAVLNLKKGKWEEDFVNTLPQIVNLAYSQRTDKFMKSIETFAKYSEISNNCWIVTGMKQSTHPTIVVERFEKFYDKIIENPYPSILKTLAFVDPKLEDFEKVSDKLSAMFEKRERQYRQIFRCLAKTVEELNNDVLHRMVCLFSNTDECWPYIGAIEAIVDYNEGIADEQVSAALNTFCEYYEKPGWQKVAKTIAKYRKEDQRKLGEYLTNPNIMKMFELYDDPSEKIMVIYNRSMKKHQMEYAEIFVTDFVVQRKKQFGDLTELYLRLENKDDFFATIALVEKHSMSYKKLLQFSNPLYMMQAYDKYPDLELDKIFDERLVERDFKELLSQRSHDLIMKSSNKLNTIRDIIEHKYSEARDMITDEIKEVVDYPELDLIRSTYGMVDSIHSRRIEFYKELKEGFQTELNRAIGQGTDYKSKVKCLRQYCKEVQQQLRDNVSELMLYA